MGWFPYWSGAQILFREMALVTFHWWLPLPVERATIEVINYLLEAIDQRDIPFEHWLDQFTLTEEMAFDSFKS